MRTAVFLALLLPLAACADDGYDDPSPETPPAAAVPVEPTSVPADAAVTCQERAREVAADRFGGQLDPVLEHSVPFRTAAVDGDGCFLTFYHDVKATQLELGADFPYPYAFVVAGDGFLKEISLAAEELPALTLAGVGFEDVDGNGEDDVFLVHAEGRGFALLSEGEANLQEWTFDEPRGALFETVAELRDHYRAAYDPAARAASAGQPATLTVTNATGMNLIFLYAAGCTESEGEDWSEMAAWATDYLGDEILEADGSVDLDLVPGCYVLNPVWEDDTSLMERVEMDGDTTVDLTLG